MAGWAFGGVASLFFRAISGRLGIARKKNYRAAASDQPLLGSGRWSNREGAPPASGNEVSETSRIPPQTIPPGIPLNRYAVFALLAIGGGALDLWTKEAIFAWRGLPGERDPWWLIDGYVGIETAVNIGAVFGIGAGAGLFFAAFSVIAAVAILFWLFYIGAARDWWFTIALGCVTGGIIGNLYDRLGLWWQSGYPEPWRSGVRDWILWQASDTLKWPNFNIADSLLVCGAGMLMWHSFFIAPDSPVTRQEATEGSGEPVAGGVKPETRTKTQRGET